MTTINAVLSSGAVASTGEEATTLLGEMNILPDPASLSGDPGAELAARAVKSGELQQSTAQKARDAQEQLEVNADRQQVDALHQKADHLRTEGFLEGAGMAAEGAGDLGGGLLARDHSQLVACDGAGKAAEGTARIFAAMPKADSANDDARAAEARSAADQAKTAADDLHDAKKGAGDFISAALDFYREYTSAQASASAAALHRA
jgi:hypothetical protein